MSTVLGNQCNILFRPFNKEIVSKVDTGASTSSLNATDITLDKNKTTVSFHTPQLSDKKISMPVVSIETVSSADGGNVPRVFVAFDIQMEDQQFVDCIFNLNDRSNMEYPVLVGQNILQAGKFTIDPSKPSEADNITESSKSNTELLTLLQEFAVILQQTKHNLTKLQDSYNNITDSLK